MKVLRMMLMAFLILMIPGMSSCKSAIAIEILAGWVIFATSTNHA